MTSYHIISILACRRKYDREAKDFIKKIKKSVTDKSLKKNFNLDPKEELVDSTKIFSIFSQFFWRENRSSFERREKNEKIWRQFFLIFFGGKIDLFLEFSSANEGTIYITTSYLCFDPIRGNDYIKLPITKMTTINKVIEISQNFPRIFD